MAEVVVQLCLQPKRCDVVHAKMLPGEVLRSNRSDERRVRAYRSIVRSRHRAWPSEAVAKYPMSPAPTRSHAADAPFIAGFARFFFFHMEMSNCFSGWRVVFTTEFINSVSSQVISLHRYNYIFTHHRRDTSRTTDETPLARAQPCPGGALPCTVYSSHTPISGDHAAS